MRRFSSLAVSSTAVRCLANISASAAEIAKAEGVTEANLKKLNPRTAAWIGFDVVSREKFNKIKDSLSPAENYWLTFNDALANAPKTTPASAKDDIRGVKDLPSLIKVYASILGPALKLKRDLEIEELEHAYLKDRLKIGLASFKQAQLDEAKTKLVTLDANIAKIKTQIAAIGKEYFTTEVFNNLINATRLMGSKNSTVQRISVELLDHMTMLKVPFDDSTKILLNNVIFGDGPLEDSGMLFAFVEYPERGEVFATSSNNLDSIATQTIKLMQDRHQTPVDHGRKLQQNDTHPCLQRSPE